MRWIYHYRTRAGITLIAAPVAVVLSSWGLDRWFTIENTEEAMAGHGPALAQMVFGALATIVAVCGFIRALIRRSSAFPHAVVVSLICLLVSFVASLSYAHAQSIFRAEVVQRDIDFRESQRFSPDKVNFVPYDFVDLPPPYRVLEKSMITTNDARDTGSTESLSTAGDWQLLVRQVPTDSQYNVCTGTVCLPIGTTIHGEQIWLSNQYGYRSYQLRLPGSVLQMEGLGTSGPTSSFQSSDAIAIFNHAASLPLTH